MSEPVDMSAPVTRRELHDAISASEHRIIEVIRSVFREYDQKIEQRFAAIDARFREAAAENGRMFRAMEESMIARVSVMLEPTKDLPPRVAALERRGFPPVAKRSRKRS